MNRSEGSPRFTLRQLEVFLAVARHGSTARAAGELHLSQSAVSAALRSLEEQYGVALFDRRGRRLALNPVGRALRARAEALLAHAGELHRALAGHGALGHLRVGASYTIANHLAVGYLVDYLARYPEAKVEFFAANSPEVVSRVLHYQVDLGMIEGEASHPDLELVPWMGDELVVFCSPDHPLAARGALSEEEIAAARWILREPGSGARQTFDRAFARFLPKLDIYLEFRHNEAIKRAVEAGLGIGCLSRIVLAGNFRDGSLVPLALPAPFDLARTFYLALPRQRHRREAVEAWVEICLAGARSPALSTA